MALHHSLSTVDFGLLQKAGITTTRNGFSAVRTAEINCNTESVRPGWRHTRRLLRRFDHLRELIVHSNGINKIFEIGSDHDISGDALGAGVRECKLNLPALGIRNLRRLTVTLQFGSWSAQRDWRNDVEPYVPQCEEIVEQGAQKVVERLGDEYKARGLRVIVNIQTDLEKYMYL